MRLARLHPRHFWSSDSGLTGLLISLVGFLALYSLEGLATFKLLSHLLFSLIIVSGVLAVFMHRGVRFFAILLAVANLAGNWISVVQPDKFLAILNAGLGFLYLGFLLAALMVQVFGEGQMTRHRIRGAIAVYLIFGLMWALLYQVMALTMSGAFNFPANITPDDPEGLQRALVYYSFITLTTLGYGDITPVLPAARTLAMFEALVGQLYPAITLARLVSLAVMHQKDKP
ncbi:MAG: potassium channel family protein [Thermodesulfobacteriota bacterium]